MAYLFRDRKIIFNNMHALCIIGSFAKDSISKI